MSHVITPRETDAPSSGSSAIDFALHEDGSFDVTLALGEQRLSIQGAYPAIDHRPLHVTAVDVDDATATYHLPGDRRITLRFESGPDRLELQSELVGFDTAPHWFAPLAGGRLLHAAEMYRTGVGFSGPSNMVSLSGEAQLVS